MNRIAHAAALIGCVAQVKRVLARVLAGGLGVIGEPEEIGRLLGLGQFQLALGGDRYLVHADAAFAGALNLDLERHAAAAACGLDLLQQRLQISREA